MSHRITPESRSTDTSCLPSAEKASRITGAVWPESFATALFSFASQICTAFGSTEKASHCPSGDAVIVPSDSLLEAMVDISAPVSAFHRFTTPSS